jgi:hypothetical protein
MATNSDTTTPKTKAATTTAKSPSTRSVPSKPRRTSRPKSTRSTPSSASKSSRTVPQWLTVGASITGAAVAIGATLFATRNEWLPRARKLGDWFEKSLDEQLGTLSEAKDTALRAVKGKAKKQDAADLPVAAPSFEASGADAAGVVVN